LVTIRWAEGERVLTSTDLKDAQDLLARPDGCVWVDMEAPQGAEQAALTDLFHFHPLAVEDAFHTGQRPKVDEFDDSFFLVAYEVDYDQAAADDEKLRACQISVFVRDRLVVTVHAEKSEMVRDLQSRCEHHTPVLRRGPDYLVYTLLDTLVDRYFPILDQLSEEIDDLEDRIVQEPRRELLDTIFVLKRLLLKLRKIAGPSRDVLTVLTTRDFPTIRAETIPYFRDVTDHLIRIYEMLDSYRELMSGALDAYLSNISNQLNLVMQRLTIVAVIFLPLTFITGVFGMNFKVQPWMPAWDHGQVFWWVMAGMTVIGFFLAVWFHRKRLI
jgi:magnesium transporter